MNALFLFWQTWGGSLISALLFCIAIVYLLRFVLPAWQLDRALHATLQHLRELPSDSVENETASRLTASFRSPQLQAQWLSYAETLQGPQAQATQPAAQRFSDEILIDAPLKTGFYRHLPGILTGIGIIGTFSGLIVGLSTFQVSSEADAVRGSLEALIRAVGHAFEISAAAITLAMLATWIEKSLTTRVRRALGQLCQHLDQRFGYDSGDVTLRRLVAACEATASHSAQLRQTLAGELRQGMQAMLAEQRNSAQQQQQAQAMLIARAVAQTIDKTLGEPLQRMTQAIEGLGAQQNTQLTQALADNLQRFGSQFDRQVGQSQSRLETLLQQTAQTLAGVVGELGKLTSSLEKSGQQAFVRAADHLQNAGNDVERAGQTFADANQEMNRAATAMAQAAQNISQSMVEQSRLQQQIAGMAADLRSTVELARRDASLTSELVGRLEHAARQLAAAEGQAGHYLQTVNQVLGETHSAFAEHLEQTLAHGNNQFQRNVVSAVEALEGVVEELADALSQPAAP